MPAHRFSSSLVFAALLATACSFPDEPVPVPSVPSSKSARLHRDARPTIDQEFIDLAQAVPGFAGMYLEHGTMIVNAQANADRAAMGRAIREWARREDRTEWRIGIGKGLAFRTVAYSFDQLAAWRVQLLSAGRIPSLVSIDVDEVNNRVQLGVTDIAAASIPARLTALGIPNAAVEVKLETPLVYETTVRDYFRPVPGGVLIEGPDWYCSIAANVNSSEFGPGFITASHCTYNFGNYADMTPFNQHVGSTNEIGVEVADGGVGECPIEIQIQGPGECRFSDAAFIGYLNPSDAQVGYVARTITPDETFLDMRSTIDANHPRFAVAGASMRRLPVGTGIYKMGKTTGWTSGTVTTTCVDYYRPQRNVWLRCNSGGNYDSAGGDSGGLIFTWDGSSTSITLQGVHVGVDYSDKVFSPWLYVDLDLNFQIGSMTVTPP